VVEPPPDLWERFSRSSVLFLFKKIILRVFWRERERKEEKKRKEKISLFQNT
jgi:hypothetical protein